MSNTPPPDDLERLEQLALGLLVTPGDPSETHPRLFLGRIPENIPVELPIPEHTQVLGTLARSEANLEIVLESKLTAEEVLSFYRTHLLALDWEERVIPAPYLRGGFTRAEPDPPWPDFSRHTAHFYHDASVARLTVMVLPIENDTSHLRLDLFLDGDAKRSLLRELMRDSQRRERIIPVLVPPPGAEQLPRSGGGGSNEQHMTATLTTSLGLEALGTHYAEQLRSAGWAQIANGLSGPLVWQSWQFTTENEKPWTGLFFALQTPEKLDDYFLYVRAALNTPAGNPHIIGWSS